MGATVTILVGIPTSGKSTWTRSQKGPGIVSISRDEVRLKVFGRDYKFSSHNEKVVTQWFNEELEYSMDKQLNIILDNTHCKEAYIDEVLKKFKDKDYNVRIKFFDISLCHAIYRNIIRRWKEGKHKWIPIKVLKQFKHNLYKIDRKKYANYTI